jgi:hypothetical protein
LSVIRLEPKNLERLGSALFDECVGDFASFGDSWSSRIGSSSSTSRT